MPEKMLQPNGHSSSAANHGSSPAGPSRPRLRNAGRRPKYPDSCGSNYDRSDQRGASLMRNRRLIMAALRVWELKNGIQNPF